MGIYSVKKVNESNITDEILEEEFIEGLKNDTFNIIFDDSIINEEYRLPNINSDGMFLYIRTQKGAGIGHDCTVKLIVGSKYVYDGKLGLPFKVSKTKPHFYIWCGDGKKAKAKTSLYEKMLTHPEYKFVKKVVNDNYIDILRYWELDLDIPAQRREAAEIEDRIAERYGVKIK